MSATLCAVLGVASLSPTTAAADPVGVCKDSRGCDGPSRNSGPSRREFEPRADPSKDDLDRKKAIEIMRAAQAMSRVSNPDAREILRMIREAQELAGDHEWMNYWAKQVEASIAEDKARQQSAAARKLAEAALEEGNAANARGDERAALAQYRRALATDPDIMSSGGKQILRNLESDIGAGDFMQKTLNGFAQNLTAAPLPSELNFVPGDTRVVDARNVASGLPKGLDGAISTAYAGAPPEVNDMVRKGFQAVMTRDWAVAKAWFQTAQLRDPNNAKLKSLIARVDEPVQPRAQRPAAATAAGSPVANLMLPSKGDIELVFGEPTYLSEKEMMDILFGLQ